MNRDFFLGALVAIALLMLWRKEHMASVSRAGLPPYITPGASAGGCAGGCGSGAAAPAAQAAIDNYSLGMVSPSAPPLGGAGTIPAETSYMSQIKLWTPMVPTVAPRSGMVPAGTWTQPASYAPNTSGPTPRAVAIAPTYDNQAFVNRTATRNLGTGRNALFIN
jgi:hypothetical protein